ncbi:MAG: nucleotidyltransferase family protein [Clostridiales bacterium]|nr:nucleotidyltransferase family protein [Clostridiales bacterium]
MRNCGIVCEYNPFHTGHRYQIERALELGASNVFCVMSGNFVQSAMPAFCDKAIRAECAVHGGANAVIELPAVYATASAGYFAEGAVKIISKIKDISHIAMGATTSADIILRLAEIKVNHAAAYNERVKSYLKSGKSYNFACGQALTELYGSITDNSEVQSVIQEPNNMLCIEYIAAIDKHAANIEPLIIKRLGATHNSSATDGDYISATVIRREAENNRFDEVNKFVPYFFGRMTEQLKHHSPDIGAYKKAALFALKCLSAEEISDLRNCSDGMEYLIKNLNAASFDDLIKSAELKKFGKKRIERLLLDCLLGIKKEYMSMPFVTRLLACRSDFDFKLLPEFVKISNADIKAAAAECKSVLEVDERATALYNTLCGIDGGYYNYSLVKV